MGRRGNRPNPYCVAEPALGIPTPGAANTKAKRKHDNIQHRGLCLLAAKWLRRSEWGRPSCPFVAVELVTATPEIPDVFGWNYWATVLIEVKVSRLDFLADAKKPFRQNPEEGVGAFRYYCCPSGMIREDEVPANWGLLWQDGAKIVVAKAAERQAPNAQAEISLLASIMRREGVKPGIFDYRKTSNV